MQFFIGAEWQDRANRREVVNPYNGQAIIGGDLFLDVGQDIVLNRDDAADTKLYADSSSLLFDVQGATPLELTASSLEVEGDINIDGDINMETGHEIVLSPGATPERICGLVAWWCRWIDEPAPVEPRRLPDLASPERLREVAVLESDPDHRPRVEQETITWLCSG